MHGNGRDGLARSLLQLCISKMRLHCRLQARKQRIDEQLTRSLLCRCQVDGQRADLDVLKQPQPSDHHLSIWLKVTTVQESLNGLGLSSSVALPLLHRHLRRGFMQGQGRTDGLNQLH